MRNLVQKLSYGPKLVSWSVYFIFALICTVIPFLGPAFLGFIIYRIVKMGEVKSIVDAYAPTVLGIIAHSLIFYLPSWSFEIFIIITFFNVICFGAISGWVRFFS